MLEDYKNALKSGQRAYRACVARGQSPYLAVLDDILVNVNIVSQEPLGLVEIPAESIVGTKTSGRHTAFAPNFMPLLEADTEFAAKWSNLCEAHLEEGIHTPIIAFEFMNRFYVQEGNKRVSVLKYYGAVKIAGTVTRLIPERNDSLENRIYYEFLDFYRLSKVNDVHFSKPGSYAKLQTLVCKASGESWTDDDRMNFAAFYTMFCQQFQQLGGDRLNITAGDAMLVYLSVYRYSDACDSTPAQMKANMEKLWNEVRVLTEPQAVHLSLEPTQSTGEPLLAKLNIFSSRPSELKVVFLHEHNAENSAWVRNHDKGRAALEKEFPDRLSVTCRENVNPEVDAEQILEDVAHDNADVIFTTSARMHTACLKVAAQHPKTRILNCSLNAPHPLVRTYYPRTYEVTYLLGLPVWKWETFYIEIIRSIFDGTWNNDGSGARAVNYWWGMRSGAEEINYSADLPAGTLQLLDLMEKLLSEDELRIFHGELYAAGHVLHAPEKLIYSPKELMEMDWLDECVDGALPHYDDLDVKTRTLVAINGLANLKKLE